MIIGSYFQNLAESQNLQFLIDASQQNLNQQSNWRNLLTPGLPQMSLNFDAAIGRERIAAAASIVDTNSPAPLRSRNKLELYKGKIPSIKQKFQLTQDDMRQIEVLRALPLATNNNAALIDFLNKDLMECAVAGDKRIDLMLYQAISTLTIDVNATNNPDGVIYGVVDLLAKDYQKQSVKTVWSDSANATPLDDLENYCRINWEKRGIQFGSIKMSQDLWQKLKNTDQVKKVLAAFFNLQKTTASYVVTLNTVNEYLTANMLPNIEIINNITMVENDGKPTYVKGFDVNNVAFTPAGKIGTLFNAVSMEQLHPIANKTYATYGSTLVSKWAESDPLTEFTAMELNAFPSINTDLCYILKTNTTQSEFI